MQVNVRRAARWVREHLIVYALKFGVVGLVGFAIDVGLFNLLRVGVLGNEGFFQGPIGAKVISVTVSTLVTWFANRYWTFRDQRRHNFILELLEFIAIAAIGMAISLFCLWISHYVLGYTTLLADNISTNVVGLTLATGFRFLMYRFWVYGSGRSDNLAAVRARQAAAAQVQADAQAPVSGAPGVSDQLKRSIR